MSACNFNCFDHKITTTLKSLRNNLTIIQTEVEKIVNEGQLRVEALELALDNRAKETLGQQRECSTTILNELTLTAVELRKGLKIRTSQLAPANWRSVPKI